MSHTGNSDRHLLKPTQLPKPVPTQQSLGNNNNEMQHLLYTHTLIFIYYTFKLLQITCMYKQATERKTKRFS